MAARLSSGTAVRDALDGAITAIAAAGCDTPRLDAELLLAHALGVSRERLLIDNELAVAGPAVRAFQELVRRRSVQREPVAYVLGARHFRRLEIAVDPRVLIPRPETELLVEVALALPDGASVLDLGTGSGAVALALKDERPDLSVTGSDLSPGAVEVARNNGGRLGLACAYLDREQAHTAAPPRLADQPPDRLQAVGACEQRLGGLVAEDLGAHRQTLAVGHVRRV